MYFWCDEFENDKFESDTPLAGVVFRGEEMNQSQHCYGANV